MLQNDCTFNIFFDDPITCVASLLTVPGNDVEGRIRLPRAEERVLIFGDDFELAIAIFEPGRGRLEVSDVRMKTMSK